MRTTETVIDPTPRETVKTTGVTCDVCGATCPCPRDCDTGLDWWGEKKNRSARLFAFRAGDADFNAANEPDICADCAARLITLLRDDAALRERVAGKAVTR